MWVALTVAANTTHNLTISPTGWLVRYSKFNLHFLGFFLTLLQSFLQGMPQLYTNLPLINKSWDHTSSSNCTPLFSHSSTSNHPLLLLIWVKHFLPNHWCPSTIFSPIISIKTSIFIVSNPPFTLAIVIPPQYRHISQHQILLYASQCYISLVQRADIKLHKTSFYPSAADGPDRRERGYSAVKESQSEKTGQQHTKHLLSHHCKNILLSYTTNTTFPHICPNIQMYVR